MNIYKGRYTSSSNQVATYKDGKIYRGKYTSSSNQVGTIGTDGKIYRGKYTSSSNQIGVAEGGFATAVAGAAFLLLL